MKACFLVSKGNYTCKISASALDHWADLLYCMLLVNRHNLYLKWYNLKDLFWIKVLVQIDKWNCSVCLTLVGLVSKILKLRPGHAYLLHLFFFQKLSDSQISGSWQRIICALLIQISGNFKWSDKRFCRHLGRLCSALTNKGHSHFRRSPHEPVPSRCSLVLAESTVCQESVFGLRVFRLVKECTIIR